MVRFERQPPGTAITRATLIVGVALVVFAGFEVVARSPKVAALGAGLSGALLLIGGNRANHGAGGPTDRMLDALDDRVWDGVVLASIGWVSRLAAPSVAAGALVALGASFLSAYVRAKGASLGYAVEESHVTRGVRYALIAAGLGFAWLRWTIWAAAAVSILAVVVRTAQVAREERA
ncbi:MAG: hypothetical protein QOG88_341 [Actinomycetota bacterium]|jgi:hypothetical protein|nr:hypothetical protein [Actinomycetota bacterium]